MVDIVARRSLNDWYTDYELSMSSNLNHKNIVSVFKICVNKGERIIILTDITRMEVLVNI
ncbi:hypothetical protein Hanom_Chr11g01054051 [Helianthus anomalus]